VVQGWDPYCGRLGPMRHSTELPHRTPACGPLCVLCTCHPEYSAYATRSTPKPGFSKNSCLAYAKSPKRLSTRQRTWPPLPDNLCL
jgi:hypothetical protein